MTSLITRLRAFAIDEEGQDLIVNASDAVREGVKVRAVAPPENPGLPKKDGKKQ